MSFHFSVQCVLQLTYTASYPDEAPIMEIVESENVDEELLTVLLDFMKEQVSCFIPKNLFKNCSAIA
jgi:hypothetical protein